MEEQEKVDVVEETTNTTVEETEILDLGVEAPEDEIVEEIKEEE